MNQLLEKVVPFRGKHKNKTIRQILTEDRGWMEWMAEKAYNPYWRGIFQEAVKLEIEDAPVGLIKPTYGSVISPYPLSIYQSAIVDAYRAGQNVAIEARAGSGKSFMLKVLAGMTEGVKVRMLAFNVHIAAELGDEIESDDITVQTVHSAALGILRERLPKRPDVDKYNNKYRDIIKSILPYDADYDDDDDDDESYDRELLGGVLKLTEMARLTLTDFRDFDAMQSVADDYNIQTEIGYLSERGEWIVRYSAEDVFSLVARALVEGERQADRLGLIDFTDMLWLVAKREYTPRAQSDVVMLDEAQDLNAAQIAVFKALGKPGCQRVAVGDPYQAIQGFAFAAYDSFERVCDALDDHKRLTMPVTYRCPIAHVRLAQQIVPDLLAHDVAAEGIVEQAHSDDLLALVKPGDLVICRTTAPLVKSCIDLLKAGIPAYVRGRAFHKELIALVKKALDSAGLPIEKARLALHQYKLMRLDNFAAEDAPESVIESFTDRVECAEAIIDAYQIASFNELEHKIISLTVNPDDELKVVLATGHRSKGDENKRVFVLNYQRLPLRFNSMSDDQAAQESFLHYVILTRSKKELYLLDDQYPSILRKAEEEPEEEPEEEAEEEEIIMMAQDYEQTISHEELKILFARLTKIVEEKLTPTVAELKRVVDGPKYTGRHTDIRRLTRKLQQLVVQL